VCSSDDAALEGGHAVLARGRGATTPDEEIRGSGAPPRGLDDDDDDDDDDDGRTTAAVSTRPCPPAVGSQKNGG